MTTLSKEQWQELERRLSNAYGLAHLTVDGYKLSLQIVKDEGLKYVIVWYVNERFEGKWLTQDCEERRRFARPIKVDVYSKKIKQSIVKCFTKKQLEERYPDIDSKRLYYQWSWPSFKPLMLHLKRNNTSMELLES